MSFKYIASGSSVFAPSGNAAVGAVGPTITSQFAKTASKSRAISVRTLVAGDFEAAFARCDVIVGPTAPTTAFPLGAKTEDPLAMYANDVFAVPASLAGVPAMSLPVGLDPEGLPVGLQVVAPLLGEARMLRTARALEADLGFDPTPRGAHALQAPAPA